MPLSRASELGTYRSGGAGEESRFSCWDEHFWKHFGNPWQVEIGYGRAFSEWESGSGCGSGWFLGVRG